MCPGVPESKWTTSTRTRLGVRMEPTGSMWNGLCNRASYGNCSVSASCGSGCVSGASGLLHAMSYGGVERVSIVGTGVIGASWAAYYLARGLDVVATDPAPNAEANLRKYVDEAWGILTSIGLSAGASRDRLSFTTNMKEALSQADFVQENGPERPAFKIQLFADMDDATPPDSIIASSSSSLTMSVIQSKCKRPERCLIGHPFNPPHIIP